MEMCPQTWSAKRQKAKVEKIKIARERQQIEGNKMKEMQWNMLKVKLEMAQYSFLTCSYKKLPQT